MIAQFYPNGKTTPQIINRLNTFGTDFQDPVTQLNDFGVSQGVLYANAKKRKEKREELKKSKKHKSRTLLSRQDYEKDQKQKYRKRPKSTLFGDTSSKKRNKKSNKKTSNYKDDSDGGSGANSRNQSKKGYPHQFAFDNNSNTWRWCTWRVHALLLIQIRDNYRDRIIATITFFGHCTSISRSNRSNVGIKKVFSKCNTRRW